MAEFDPSEYECFSGAPSAAVPSYSDPPRLAAPLVGVPTATPSQGADHKDVEEMRRKRASKYNMSKFNEIFEQHRRKDDPNEQGYQDWLKRFQFDPNQDEIQLQQQQQQRYLEPEPLQFTQSGKNAMCYAELGLERVEDFGRRHEVCTRGGVQYCDLRMAHSTQKLIDPDTVPSREEFASLESLQEQRSKVDSIQLTPQQREALERSRLRRSEMDAARRQHLSRFDADVEAQHAAVQAQLFGGATYA